MTRSRQAGAPVRHRRHALWPANAKRQEGKTVARLRIDVFRNSADALRELLDESGIAFQEGPKPSGIQMNAAEILSILEPAAICGSLATVLIAFIKSRRSRKVIITTKKQEVIHAEGLSPKELTELLKQARSVMAFDPGGDEDE